MDSPRALPTPLTIGAAQPPCVPYDVETNAAAHAAIVRDAGVRVVVFPELSLTGYELDAPALDPGDVKLRPIVDACATSRTVALVGAPSANHDGDHISIVRVDEHGAEVVYRKMWLSDQEAERFTAGTEPAIVVVDGWRIGLAICKDTGVVEHAGVTARQGMDVYAAGVLDSADDASIQEERALRIIRDHQVWVVIASFAGSTGGGYQRAAAQSRIWSPEGTLVASAGQETGRTATATLKRRPSYGQT